MQARSRITELPNAITSEIDQCNPLGIVRLLRQSDAQLFAGWGDHDSISDPKMLRKIDALADKAAGLLQENDMRGTQNTFLFTGCGTSGRIAWTCSRSFNRLLKHMGKHPCFGYLIAGGDKALIVGEELPEDDPLRGVRDLVGASSDVDHVMLIGITCGLSAPYVAGQIDYTMQKEKFTTVLLGFNPVDLARDSGIEKWDKTCRQTFLRLAKVEESAGIRGGGGGGMILNPVVGPEPITGSSRMKGGSMTAILLNIVFMLALSRAYSIPLAKLLHDPSLCEEGHVPDLGSNDEGLGMKLQDSRSTDESTCHKLSKGEGEVATLVDAFNATYNSAYRPTTGIASLVGVAGACLRQPGGHVYYVGAQLFGIVGFVDSSEMVSTFGSSRHEVRGFVEGGWEVCMNREGDLSEQGPLFCISIADFEKNIVPTLCGSDCVIACMHGIETAHESGTRTDNESSRVDLAMEKVLPTAAKCCVLAIVSSQHNNPPHFSDPRYVSRVLVKTPYSSVAGKEPVFGAFALKLILNAVSTGANVLKGKVYGNTMINLTMANDKLFYRSVSIVADLSKVSKEDAEKALLKAIYEEDQISKYASLPVSHHIKTAAKKNMVVPLAIVLASQRCEVKEALCIITATASLRSLVESSITH